MGRSHAIFQDASGEDGLIHLSGNDDAAIELSQEFSEPLTAGWWHAKIQVKYGRLRTALLKCRTIDDQYFEFPFQRTGESSDWQSEFYSPTPIRFIAIDLHSRDDDVRICIEPLKRLSNLIIAKNLGGILIKTFRRDRLDILKNLPRYLKYLANKGPKRIGVPHIDATVSKSGYARWLQKHDYNSKVHYSKAKAIQDGFGNRPLISIIIPIYNTPVKLFEELLNSIKSQVYENWELCLADDASTDPHVVAMLTQAAENDTRIKVTFRTQNGHISAASNSALDIATGDIVTFVDHDDKLHPLSLFHIAKSVQENPDWRIIYSDEDKLDPQGRRSAPYFKGTFNRDLFYGHNMMTHLIAYRRDDLIAIGGFRQGVEGAQDYDVALRILERIDFNTKAIVHIPHVLYHWRQVEGSVALNADQKGYAHNNARKAIAEHLLRIGSDATVQASDDGTTHLLNYATDPSAFVSIIIATRDRVDLLKNCIESIFSKTKGVTYEIIIVDNNSVEPETHRYFDWLRSNNANVKIVCDEGEFNFSRLNNLGVAAASGEYLCLLNNDTEVIEPRWLHYLLMHLQRGDVGAVGAKLLYSNGTIQHAGVGTGLGGYAAHPYANQPENTKMNIGKAQLTQSVSAVTGACLATTRQIYNDIGGLDEELFAVAYNDVDFCLEVWRRGAQVIYEPRALLFHHESATRGSDTAPDKIARFTREKHNLKDKWAERISYDPFINPNFSLNTANFQLSDDPPDILD